MRKIGIFLPKVKNNINWRVYYVEFYFYLAFLQAGCGSCR